MITNKRFGELLSEGIVSVANRQREKIGLVEETLADELGYGRDNIQRWRRGYVPKQPEQVAFLVHYCVDKGRVDRNWASSFLAQARYPQTDALLQELFPEKPPLSTLSKHIYHNLPPIYGEFLGRETDIARVREGLASRWPLVSIEGLGGVGKTTLAIESARRCMAEIDDTTEDFFVAIVWISARDRPEQKQWLTDVLDSTARVLDYPYIKQQPIDEKTAAIDYLLRTQRTLVIVDNFETIDDPELEQWLHRIPEPSKALLTTRYGQMRSVWAIQLYGLAEPEALLFIHYHARRLGLKMIETAADTDLLPLIHVTDGNPKAIEMALGYIKRGVLTLEEVINHLHQARQTVNDIFEYLFDHAWKLLTEGGRSVFLAISLFVNLTSKEALGATAGLKDYYLDLALEQLAELSLLDSTNNLEGKQHYYNTHPLARAFSRAKLHENPDFKKEARQRQAYFYEQLLPQYQEIRAALPNVNQEVYNILDCINWCRKAGKDHLFISLVANIWEFCNLLGLWDEFSKLAIEAMEIGNKLNEPISLRKIIFGLAMIAYNRGQLDQAEQLILKMKQISENIGDWEEVARAHKNLGHVAKKRGDFDVAERLLLQALEMAQQANSEKEVLRITIQLGVVAMNRGDLSTACERFELAMNGGNQKARREVLDNYAQLALLQGDNAKARALLEERLEWPNLTRSSYARIQHLYAKIETAEGNLAKALVFVRNAYDIFHRLGIEDKKQGTVELIAELEEKLAESEA